MNVDTEKKLKTSSVKHLDNCLKLDLPGPSLKEPNWRVGTPDKCQEGIRTPRQSTTNVGSKTKHQVSSYSPRDRGEAAIAKPRLPLWEVKQEIGRASCRERV